MALHFQGSVSIAGGLQNSSVIAIPVNQQRAGQQITASLQAENFPAGTTEVVIFLSTDGGTVYRSASMTCINPAFWRGAPPHWWTLGVALSPLETPTHMKYQTTAPQAFTTTVKIETD